MTQSGIEPATCRFVCVNILIILNKLTTTWCNQVWTSHKTQIRYFEIRTLNSVLKNIGNGQMGREGLLDLGVNWKITMDPRINRVGDCGIYSCDKALGSLVVDSCKDANDSSESIRSEVF